MTDTLNHVLTVSLDYGWKVCSVLTFISVIDMSRQLLRRTRHLHA